MDFKKFWKESFAGYIIKHVALAILLIIVIAWIALFAVDKYTQHGEYETVPDLRGLYVEEAALLLSNQGLHPEIIDSVFLRDKRLGTIVEQTPPPNSTIKRDRPVYIITNSRQVRQVPLPDVSDISLRQADAMIKAIGLNISGIEYSPSEYKDLVIGVKFNGKNIEAGTRVPENSYLSLVVGSGYGGGEEVIVPNLHGTQLEDARIVAANSSLVVGATQFDVQPNGNEEDYVIYRQRPAAGKSIGAGSRIDIWLSKDKSLLNKTFDEENTEEDEQFF